MRTDEIQPGRYYRVSDGGKSYILRAVGPSIAIPTAWACRHPDGRISIHIPEHILYECTEDGGLTGPQIVARKQMQHDADGRVRRGKPAKKSKPQLDGAPQHNGAPQLDEAPQPSGD